METASKVDLLLEPIPQGISTLIDRLNTFAEEGADKWFKLCYRFLDWERSDLVLGNPNAETKASHKKALFYLLKMTEFQAGLNEKDEKLQTLLWRLRESWDFFYNPPSKEEAVEAEKLLATLFPE